jgi:hypothetical protein
MDQGFAAWELCSHPAPRTFRIIFLHAMLGQKQRPQCICSSFMRLPMQICSLYHTLPPYMHPMKSWQPPSHALYQDPMIQVYTHPTTLRRPLVSLCKNALPESLGIIIQTVPMFPSFLYFQPIPMMLMMSHKDKVETQPKKQKDSHRRR